MNLKELIKRREALLAKAEAIINEAEKRADKSMTSEELSQHSNHLEEVRNIDKQIDALTAGLEARKRNDQLRKVCDDIAAEELEKARRSSSLSRSEARDVAQFSFVRFLRNMIAHAPQTGIEAEMVQEGEREAPYLGNGGGNGVLLSSKVFQKRDLTATGGSAGDQGGVMVATEVRDFIDLLRNRLVLRPLGLRYLTGLTSNIRMPRLATDAAFASRGENVAAAESSPTFGAVTLSPKRLPTYIEVSKQLILQGAPGAPNASVENLVRDILASRLAVDMEALEINGTGDNDQPTGILNTPNIGAVVGGTDGLAMAWSHVVGLESAVALANADIGALAYLTNTKVRGKLKQTLISSADTGSNFIWKGGEFPLNEYRCGITNNVPSTLTKNSSVGVCSAAVFGNFSDAISASWGGVEFLVNPYSKDTEGLIRINCAVFHDFAVLRPGSFAAMLDILTA